MKYSKFNIFSRSLNSGKYLIVNLLSGNADILDPSEAEKLESIRKGNDISDQQFIEGLADKGYISDEAAELNEYRNKYFDFIDNREREEIQIFFVTNYSCNFSCSYCYQDQYHNPDTGLNREVIDAFFSYIKREFNGRGKYVTLFGGEPLLNSPKQKKNIQYIINKSVADDIKLCFVTNGYTLEEYMPLLKVANIREIQVTVDGPAEVHDSRRPLKGGGKTFDKIVRGIDACLENNFDVNLRMVVDKENITGLPELAKFAIDKEWTKNRHFKTQIGRNYELHHYQNSPDKLFSRISLYESIFDLTEKFPFIVEFYKPAYSVTKFLSENGELPEPLFDSCPACKTEWAFDYTGRIYPCTATVGKSDEVLGSFYPEISLDTEKAGIWQGRDVTSIADCKDCNLQLACGGGCGSVARNRTGSVCSADCRPVKELIELGFSAYFDVPEKNSDIIAIY